MLRKPKLKTFLTVFPISEGAWGLRGGNEEMWKIKLRDDAAVRAFTHLLPFLDGRHETGAILEELSAQGIDPQLAGGLLDHFEKSAFLEEADTAGTLKGLENYQDQITFFSRFTQDGGATLQAKLQTARVGVVAGGRLSQSVVRHLELSGFGEIVLLESGPDREQASGAIKTLALNRRTIWPDDATGEMPEIFVVPQEAHDPQLLEAMDALSKRHKIPWLLLRSVDPHEGWVGPLFIPGETASYVSLEARYRGNHPFFEEYRASEAYLLAAERPSSRCGGLYAFADLLSAIAVSEIIKLVTGIGFPQLAGKFLTVDLGSWETEIHEVLRVPRLEMETYSQPRIFPWKDIPYGDKETRRA